MLIAVLSVLFGSVILDQLTKAIVVSQMALYEEVPFLPGLIRFYHTRNTGAAFSMFSDNRWVFMVFSVIAMVIMTYLLVKFHGRHWLLSVSLAAVLGGGIGNMIDRVLSGYVVDFLDFQFMKFAVFNVADICVVVGGFAAAVYYLLLMDRLEGPAAGGKEEETGHGDPDAAV